MKLDLFRYTCARCGSVFEEADLVGGYGKMLARSTGQGSMALVDALHDDIFAEVERLASKAVDRSVMPDWKFGNVGRYVFSVACDPDDDGSPFRIGEQPACPICGSHQMDSWERTGRLVELEVPLVGHRDWNRLDVQRRTKLVNDAVNDFLSW
jgi:hypothetical protein